MPSEPSGTNPGVLFLVNTEHESPMLRWFDSSAEDVAAEIDALGTTNPYREKWKPPEIRFADSHDSPDVIPRNHPITELTSLVQWRVQGLSPFDEVRIQHLTSLKRPSKDELVELVEIDNALLRHRQNHPPPSPTDKQAWIQYTKQESLVLEDALTGLGKRPRTKTPCKGRKKKKCDENDSSTWTLEFLTKKAEEDNIKLPKGNRGFKLAYYRKWHANRARSPTISITCPRTCIVVFDPLIMII